MTPKEQACDVAQRLLDGTMPLIEACRSIQRPLAQLGLREDPEFITFVGIDSEADQYPFGPERRYWNKDVLAKLEEELRGFESHYHPSAEEACRAILRRLGAGS